MEDSGAFDLNLTCVEVSLEVLAVVLCVPETPLEEGEELEGLGLVRGVLENNLLNLTVIVLRNKEGNLSLKAVLRALDNCVAHTVTAGIAVKLCFNRAPAGVPYCALIVDIEVSSAHINGDVVVTVSCDSSESCVLKEAVASCGIGDQREELLCSEVVYPRIGSSGVCDDIFLIGVIEKTKLHSFYHLS